MVSHSGLFFSTLQDLISLFPLFKFQQKSNIFSCNIELWPVTHEVNIDRVKSQRQRQTAWSYMSFDRYRVKTCKQQTDCSSRNTKWSTTSLCWSSYLGSQHDAARPPAGARTAANQLHVAADCWLSIDGTDRRTDTVPLHRRSLLEAGSDVNKRCSN